MTTLLSRPTIAPRRVRVRVPLPPLKRTPELVEIAIRVLLVVAVVCGWVLAFALGLSRLQHSTSQHRLYAEFRQALAQGVAPVGGRIEPGKPVALLGIPALGIRGETVVEGTTSGDLRAGPGHLRTTPLPGQAGVSVLYGRTALFGGPFGRIASLQPGDIITATTGLGIATFAVDQIRQAGDPLPAIPAAGTARLTLVTSQGSGWSRDGTVYVDATLSNGTAFDTPAGRAAELSSAELAMRGDSSEHVLIQALLGLQLAVLVALGLVWLRHRVSSAHTWLIGVPIALLTAWILSSVSVQLLPNLL